MASPKPIADDWFACIICGTPVQWIGTGRKPLYCSGDCKAAMQRTRGRLYKPSSVPCMIEGCERPHHGRGLCKPHWKQWNRTMTDARPPSDAWNERRRDAYHRRRAGGVRTGLRGGERIMYRDLLARDGSVCQGCGAEIDMALEWPDRWSKSLDHIIPISRGGRHVLDNVRLMHFWCNSAKGNRSA